MRYFFKKDGYGVSLYVAIVFVSAMMLVSASLARAIMVGNANRIRYTHKSHLKYLTESAEEAAQWLAVHVLPEGGVESDIAPAVLQAVQAPLLAAAAAAGIDVSTCDDIDSDPGNGLQPCFAFTIRGRGSNAARFAGGTFRFKEKDVYSIPLPGTGSVTSTCVDQTNIDDPCNWNKLYYDESIEIPLYYTDAQGVDHVPDFSPQNRDKAFFLRMRTPCASTSQHANEDALAAVQRNFPQIQSVAEALRILHIPATIPSTRYPRTCAPTERVILYPAADVNNPPQRNPDYLSFSKDPVIVQWLIKAEGAEELIAREETINGKRPALNSLEEDFQVNSQLTAGRLNGANNTNYALHLNHFVTIDNITQGAKILASNLTPQVISHIFDNRLRKPKLKLNAITRFRTNDDQRIYVPYIEYQLLTSAPVTDAETKIEVTVHAFDMSSTRRAKIKRLPGPDDFVLGNL